jgi:hypothetical protein
VEFLATVAQSLQDDNESTPPDLKKAQSEMHGHEPESPWKQSNQSLLVNQE